MWSNGIKIAFFPNNYEESPSGWVLCLQTPIASSGWGFCPQTPVCDTFQLQYTSLLKHLFQFRHCHILTIGLSPLFDQVPSYASTPGHGFHDIFVPTKISFEVSDDVIACDLWFGSSQSKVLDTLMRTVRLNTLFWSRNPSHVTVRYLLRTNTSYEHLAKKFERAVLTCVKRDGSEMAVCLRRFFVH